MNQNNTNKAKFNWRVVVIYSAAAVLVALIIAMLVFGTARTTEDPKETQGKLNVQVETLQEESYDMGNDLGLLSVGKFAGIYLEDGSNEVVSNIMMIQVVNNSQKDLQLAKIKLEYAAFTAEFEATNIPAGRTVVLLEKNRRAYVEEKYTSVSTQNVVFFQNKMTTQEDRFKISGLEGALNVTNISEEDISEDVYVYYKYISGDRLYGGITFRTKIQGGMKFGELKQVMTSHYDPDTCQIVAVEIGG